jgi:hypothetical protein
MDANMVAAIVLGEIGDDLSITNLHGYNLSACLVNPPRKQEYDYHPLGEKPGGVRQLWLVLQKHSDSSGYQIVFDEDRKEFGLATPGYPGHLPCCIGLYGSFIDAFKAM